MNNTSNDHRLHHFGALRLRQIHAGQRAAASACRSCASPFPTPRARRGARNATAQDYYFITRDEFEERLRNGEFLEHAEVFGNYYGTHRSELDRAAAEGKDLVLDIDVQGARQLKGRIPEAVSIFILAPSRQILEAAACGRGLRIPKR